MHKQYVITMERHERESYEQRFQALSSNLKGFINQQTDQEVKFELWEMVRELNSLGKIVE